MIQFPFWAHYAKMILILGKKLKWKVSIATLKFVRLKFTCIWYWERLDNYISSVIRQKGESQNGCFKKTKHAKFSEKQTFLTPDMHTYVWLSGSKNCSFFGKFGVHCFLETPVLRFALLPYYRQLGSMLGECTQKLFILIWLILVWFTANRFLRRFAILSIHLLELSITLSFALLLELHFGLE